MYIFISKFEFCFTLYIYIIICAIVTFMNDNNPSGTELTILYVFDKVYTLNAEIAL